MAGIMAGIPVRLRRSHHFFGASSGFVTAVPVTVTGVGSLADDGVVLDDAGRAEAAGISTTSAWVRGALDEQAWRATGVSEAVTTATSLVRRTNSFLSARFDSCEHCGDMSHRSVSDINVTQLHLNVA